jgi:hypothetical protein
MKSKYTLAEIRLHPDFPFANWQTDDLSFLMSELYWSCLAEETIGEEASYWKPEFDSERDGNPILTIVNRSSLRGLRVVMLMPKINISIADISTNNSEEDISAPPFDLYPYLNVGKLADGETDVSELVLLARIGVGTEELVRKLIHLHCVQAVSAQSLEAEITDYERHLGLL